VREGTGEHDRPDGSKLRGTFRNNIAVEGELKFANGDRYKGQLKNGLKHGKGGSPVFSL
jgi:hypothetical protein